VLLRFCMRWDSSFLLVLTGHRGPIFLSHMYTNSIPNANSKSINIFCYLIRALEISIPYILRRAQISRLIHHDRILEAKHNSALIKSFSLLALGIWLSTLSTLNFSLGFFVGVLCFPLTFFRPIDGIGRGRVVITVLAILVMQLISPLNWFYIIAKVEFGQSAAVLARMYRFAWVVWGTWTPLVWWCVWWPAWVTALVVLVSPQ
jgi:GPI-anchor transamidase subunit GAA1